MQTGLGIAGTRRFALTALATGCLLCSGLLPLLASAAPATGSKPTTKAAATGSKPTAKAAVTDSKAGASPSKSAASEGSGDEKADEAEPKENSDASALTKAPPSAIPEGTPPKPPKPEDQALRPYVPPRETVLIGKERHITLSAVAGVWLHGLNGSGASSKAGPVWGVSGRVDPYRWLGIRITVLRGNQPVTPSFGALEVPGAQIEQPDFEIIHWTFRLEPTWHVTPTLALWAGTGFGWARAIAPEPKVGNLNWVTANRACVYVDTQLALGAQYELVRDWVTVALDLSASSLGYQHGTAHEPLQAFTPEGHMTHIGGYPNFAHKVQGLFGLGIIL